MRLLCVCTGNICRSPMLEYLLRRELPKYGLEDVEVSSAGTGTVDGEPASTHAITAMNEIGIDIADHRSRRVTAAMAQEADVIVALTVQHGVQLAFLHGADPKKIVVPGGGIADPFGQDLATYRTCRDEMIAAIPQLAEDIKAL